jgi:hypothetical protein
VIRDSLGPAGYWHRWTTFDAEAIATVWAAIGLSSGNPAYEPQFLFNQTRRHWESMLRRYSAGDPVSELSDLFDGLLRSWEASVRLGEGLFTAEQKELRRSWSKNLDFYVVSFWLVGLALALDLPDLEWQRLIGLIGNEGEDALLDRIIASRSQGRRIGSRLCHPKPYARLLAALEAPTPEERARLLGEFLRHWYGELDRKGTREVPAVYARPYWYQFGEQNFEGGAYFGRWCVEAVAAVKAFGLDDRACLGHPYYPGDLLRPDGPSTHKRVEPEPAAPILTQPPPAKAADRPAARSWLHRFFGRNP